MSGGEVRVAIVNYGVGNLLSIATSLSRVGAQPTVIKSIDEAESFDAVVFPGVGAFKPLHLETPPHRSSPLRQCS
ncbi:MAG: hypothetical protein J7L98_03785 [Candidatus Verstraetearchaeota archaeon]|nr:hypothetical protein [Candidatus Verstraetearchaeota archaeon]